MKAMVQRRFGGPETLDFVDLDEPEIGDDEVLVRVRAASVGPWVWRMMRPDPIVMRILGAGVRRPKQSIAATDIAGTVERVGSAVSQFSVGDDVFGECDGAFAELVAAPMRALAPKPGGLTFEQAAAVPVAGSTALIGLRDHGQLRAGQSVLIIGASGGVGTFAVQIARALGADVTAVCGTDAIAMVRELGADHVIDYTSQELGAAGVRYDVIFQGAGTESPSRLRRLLTRSGRLVLTSGEGGRLVGPLPRLAIGLIQSPFVSQSITTYVAKADHEILLALTALIDRGNVRPIVDRTYPLVEMGEAIRHVENGPNRGKTVVTI